MRWIAVAAVFAATPAVAADQFDLVCQVEYRTSPQGRWRAVEARYHADLAANRWCGGDCDETRPFHEITEARLVLRYQESTIGNPAFAHTWIDRRTGELHDLVSGNPFQGIYFEQKGTCSPSEFTGFPVPRSRF